MEGPGGAGQPMKSFLREKIRRIPWLKALLLPVVNEWAALAFAWKKFQFPLTKYPPLNGQERRREAMVALLKAIDPEEIIETGTFFGSTTLLFGEQTDCRVYTVDINRFFSLAARIRAWRRPRIRMMAGESMKLLKERQRAGAGSRRTFFYLDAHWGENLPLREEVQFILKYWTETLICIDDFRVPDDPGYRFDRYGDKRLEWDYLQLDQGDMMDVYYPTAPSDSDTGLKRGVIYLAVGADVRERVASCVPVFLRKAEFKGEALRPV